MYGSVGFFCSLALLVSTAMIPINSAEADSKMEGTPRKDDPLDPHAIDDRDLSTRIGNLDRTTFKRYSVPSIRSCRRKFRGFPDHTMCLPDYTGVRNSGVSKKEKGIIVNTHNSIRANVHPPAGNMQRMSWDKRLAEVAQKWAAVCQPGHDKVRNLPGVRASVGQNVLGSTKNVSWQWVLNTWSDEANNFIYGQDPEKYLPDIGASKYNLIGHYTQVVKAESSRIGCGYAECPNLLRRHRFVCNYTPGQKLGDLRKPYEADKRCSQCGAFCTGGLCDCGGLVCENNSKMNASVCACDCHHRFSGRDCAEVNCELDDNPLFCQAAKPSFCSRITNVPQECPHMCELCSDENMALTSPRPLHPEPVPTSDLHISSGLDDDDREMILRKLNKHRDDEPLVWDNILEEHAQNWANQCKPRKNSNVAAEGHFDMVDQLRGLGYRSWEDTIETWEDQPDFSKVLSPNVTSIGCGFAECEHKRKRFYFCNYGGNEPVASSGNNPGSRGPKLPKCTVKDSAVCSLISDNDCLRQKRDFVYEACPMRCGLCRGE